jgi:hypothetical protein
MDLGNSDHLKYLDTLYDLGEFHALQGLFCVPKTCIFTSLTIYTLLHMNSIFL